MRTSAWTTWGLAALAALLALPGRAQARANNPPWPGWHGLGVEDVFLLEAVRAKPEADSELRADLGKLDDMPAGPQKAAEEARFRGKWMERIQTFSQTYRPGQNWPGRKPSVAEARQRVPWLSEMDLKGWNGKIFPYLRENLDAPELGLILKRMEYLNSFPQERTRATLTEKLNGILARVASGETVAQNMIGSIGDKDTIRDYMATLQREALDRAPTVIAAAKQQAQVVAENPAQTGPILDGARLEPSEKPPVVVSAPSRNGPPAEKPPTQLQPKPPTAAPTAPAGNDRLARMTPPPPDTDAREGPGAPNIRPSVKDVATSPPALGMLGGALLGAGIGLLFGGFIGALIGAGVGLLLGAAGGFGFLLS